MYHRILPQHDPRYEGEEPGMIVEPHTFQQHLKQIKHLFTPMHLSEWVDRQQKGLTLPNKACAITFDDGWVDNYEYALPIIEQEQVPITLFAVSDMIGTQREFWPNQISTLVNTRSYEELLELPWLKPHLGGAKPNTQDQLSELIHSLKQHNDEQIFHWLSETTIPTHDNNHLMSWQQLKQMSQSPLIEIGSHTCNHFRLNSQLSEEVLSAEIINSKNRLDDELSQQTQLFCYPNGDTCSKAIDLVGTHYQAAVTTKSGINKANAINLQQLTRIGIHEDVSNTATRFQARLANWF